MMLARFDDCPERFVRRGRRSLQSDHSDPKYPPLRVTEEYVTRLRLLRRINARLSKLDSFILPGGAPGAALLHRGTQPLRAAPNARRLPCSKPSRSAPASFPHSTLNRLSDLLFILGRRGEFDGTTM
jgi:cob(I)alamin adenosyltransferase